MHNYIPQLSEAIKRDATNLKYDKIPSNSFEIGLTFFD